MGLLEQVQRGKTSAPPRLLVYGSEGIGKAQPLDAQVLTPSGFRAMEDIAVGDEVIGGDGRPRKVLSVFPQGIKPVYRVAFHDGTKTECCDEHLWFTWTERDRRLGRAGKVRSLAEIRQAMISDPEHGHAVPRVAPVEFALRKKTLPVEPWLLGIHLVDLAATPTALFEYADNLAVARHDLAQEVWDGLKRVGVVGGRHLRYRIPRRYLTASVADRLELLRGLLEEGGETSDEGRARFTTHRPGLADDVAYLARSVGAEARVALRTPIVDRDGYPAVGEPNHVVEIAFARDCQPNWSRPENWAATQAPTAPVIQSIVPIGEKPCQCIRVDANDGLYVTDDFIVTHNSSFGANAPKPIFVQTEDGLNEIDCAKFPLVTRYTDVTSQLTALATEPHDFQTIVLDSLDWLERLIWDQTCADFGVKSIEKVDGGYGKGYVHALGPWRKIVDLLARLHRERGMAVILLAHAKVEKFEDPESQPYDRYSPRLHKHACPLISEWVDAVLFATRKFRTQTSDAGFGRERTIAAPIGKDGGERILRTIGGPACVAKNRYGFPAELPLDWDAVMAALSKAPT